jgi:hypothetical protein
MYHFSQISDLRVIHTLRSGPTLVLEDNKCVCVCLSWTCVLWLRLFYCAGVVVVIEKESTRGGDRSKEDCSDL